MLHTKWQVFLTACKQALHHAVRLVRSGTLSPPSFCCLLAPAPAAMPPLLGLSADSLRLPGLNSDDPSAATILERALERQALYRDLDTETQRKGLLLGHEVISTYTQSQLFDKVTKPGHWRKPTVKAIMHPLEVWVVAPQVPACAAPCMGANCGPRHASCTVLVTTPL
jgi:hypothetical protein